MDVTTEFNKSLKRINLDIDIAARIALLRIDNKSLTDQELSDLAHRQRLLEMLSTINSAMSEFVKAITPLGEAFASMADSLKPKKVNNYVTSQEATRTPRTKTKNKTHGKA